MRIKQTMRALPISCSMVIHGSLGALTQSGYFFRLTPGSYKLSYDNLHRILGL